MSSQNRTPTPKAFISTHRSALHNGERVWQVFYQGMPLTAEISQADALAVWKSWRSQGSQSHSAQFFTDPPPIYDGDTGQWQEQPPQAGAASMDAGANGEESREHGH